HAVLAGNSRIQLQLTSVGPARSPDFERGNPRFGQHARAKVAALKVELHVGAVTLSSDRQRSVDHAGKSEIGNDRIGGRQWNIAQFDGKVESLCEAALRPDTPAIHFQF